MIEEVNKSTIYPFSSYLELAIFSDSSSSVISLSFLYGDVDSTAAS